MLNTKFPYTMRHSLCPSLTTQIGQHRMHKDCLKNEGRLRNRYEFVVGETRKETRLGKRELVLK
jgi:hypothetical protein